MLNNQGRNRNIDYYRFYNKYLRGRALGVKISSDIDNGDLLEDGLASRDDLYTTLLKDYASISRKRSRLKEFHKWVYFWILMIGLIAITIITLCITNKIIRLSHEEFIESISALIASLIAFISSIIAIPLTITKFLFNIKEDDNITSVIIKTQEHDANSIKLLESRFKKITPKDAAMQNESDMKETKDN